MILDDAAIMII